MATDGFGAQIGTDVKYAPYVEFGTAPHVIYPKNKNYLAFQVGGKWVFTKEVHHPGTKEHAFLFPAFEIVSGHLEVQLKGSNAGR